jgi:hypothetical protein
MNAYMCRNRLDFAALEYQSVAADFKTRIMWPVSLTADGGNYTTYTNAWREWDWMGGEPQNHRFGRFVSIVKLNHTYNMSFTAEPPTSLQFQLQKRTPLGNNSNWVQVRIYYPLPNSIRIVYNNAIVTPILLTDINYTTPGLASQVNVSQCGSNIYFYNNYTTTFIVTEGIDCLITV